MRPIRHYVHKWQKPIGYVTSFKAELYIQTIYGRPIFTIILEIPMRIDLTK